MNLFRAELSRLLARRFSHIMLIGMVAVFGITVATVLASSQKPTAQTWADAESAATSQRSSLLQWQANCERAKDSGEAEAQAFPEDCRTRDPNEIEAEDFLWGVFVFTHEIRGLAVFLVVYLSFFGFVLAASFVGAEMGSGGITNLLLWRPQRSAVLGAKLAAVLTCVTAFAAAFTVLYVGTFYLIAVGAGWVGEAPPAFWSDLITMCVRGVAMSIAAAGCAFALATLARHTAAALGIVVGYFLIWEAGARIVFEIVGALPYDPYFLSSYLAAFVNGDLRYWQGYDGSGDLVITQVTGGIVVTALTAALITAAFANFRRRDLA
ncbi:ABC transporter permease subunit [Catellatospora sp. NPDC049609]|uniref:ABC transporter permease subunit n=1 Tax=Catellatospora sp. NPDC049609 TaxID=3155505 RepID=UPI003413F879